MVLINQKWKGVFMILLWSCLYCGTSFGQQNNIQGRVYQDLDLNCAFTNGDIHLSGIVVSASLNGANDTYYGTTDANGYYSITCPLGTYTVRKASYTPYTVQNCVPFAGVVTTQVSDTIDFPLEISQQCPSMNVGVSVPNLEEAKRSTYSIQYCNNGTVDGHNVQVEVEIDTFLNVQGFSLFPMSQVGNIYLFNIGTVAVAECGFIYIDVEVDTSAILGQTHCVEAAITSDTLCTTSTNNNFWVDIEGTCQNDSVLFTVTNRMAVGAVNQPYFVFEDDLIMRVGNINIANGSDTVVGISALPRKFYRIEVGHIINAPDSIFSAFVEGCVRDTNGEFNTGFPTQYNNGSNNISSAIDCQQNRILFDSNLKMAQPVGYQSDHYINSEQYIDYQLNFQNTGIDTIFKVILIDTLPPYLNPARIALRAASHPYTWQIKENGILEVRFDSIQLPSSGTNEPASHGFAKFKIWQNFNNPVGTIINNFADIYFDSNPPIRTNTSFHEIGADFYTVGITPVCPFPNRELRAYPNPFKNSITITVGDTEQDLTLLVYDVMGRQVGQVSDRNATQIILERNELEAGVYIYSLFANGTMIGTGKIVARN